MSSVCSPTCSTRRDPKSVHDRYLEWMTVNELAGRHTQGCDGPQEPENLTLLCYSHRDTDIASVYRAVRKLEAAGLVETKIIQRNNMGAHKLAARLTAVTTAQGHGTDERNTVMVYRLKWTPEDEHRWPDHAGADPQVSLVDTFGTQTGYCPDCGMTYRIQDEEPGSEDGHRDRDWSLFSTAPDGTIKRLKYRTSIGIVYKHATRDHNGHHPA